MTWRCIRSHLNHAVVLSREIRADCCPRQSDMAADLSKRTLARAGRVRELVAAPALATDAQHGGAVRPALGASGNHSAAGAGCAAVHWCVHWPHRAAPPASALILATDREPRRQLPGAAWCGAARGGSPHGSPSAGYGENRGKGQPKRGGGGCRSQGGGSAEAVSAATRRRAASPLRTVGTMWRAERPATRSHSSRKLLCSL